MIFTGIGIYTILLGNLIHVAISKDAALETVSKHGKLSVNGVNLIDEHGDEVQLKGMSLFWSVWCPNFYNKTSLDGIQKNCHSNVVRAVMAVDTISGGYLTDPDSEYQLVQAVVDAAIANDMYVLVDWQDFNAENHMEQASEFFDKLSKKYSNYPNIIYEPYNEPITNNWSNVVKPYHEHIIKTIRANDPDNLIILGTPQYSTQVNQAAADPIVGQNNIMYSLHFYTGTQQQPFRDIALSAYDDGLPIFVTEYGTVYANATGPVNIEEAELWYAFMDERGISYINWSICNIEDADALIAETTPEHVCEEEYLSESGRLVVSHNKG